MRKANGLTSSTERVEPPGSTRHACSNSAELCGRLAACRACAAANWGVERAIHDAMMHVTAGALAALRLDVLSFLVQTVLTQSTSQGA